MTEPALPLREKLSQETATVDWSLLAPHAKSEKLIVVDPSIVLLDAAVSVAQNDAAQVTAWIEGGQLTKLSPNEQTELEQEKAVFFEFVVVAPFVLAKRVLLAPQSS